LYRLKNNPIKAAKKNSPTKANHPQNGAVTHHHDQDIKWVNLSTINTANKTDDNPKPVICVLFIVIIY